MNSRRAIEAGVQSLTLADRVVNYFNPGKGLERLRARTMLASHGIGHGAGVYGGYLGGRRDRRATRNWRPLASSADRDILYDLPELRARSRDLRRNVPIATGAIATDITNVVGDGLQLQASIDAEALGLTPEQADAWERAAESEWRHACGTLDFTRVQDFSELQALAFGSVLESGDTFCVRRYRKDPGDVYGTKIQLLEADRVSNPNRAIDTTTLAGGVEIDQDGVHVAYHVTDKHPGGLQASALKWQRVEARTGDGKQAVLHLYERLRSEQTRGVPYLAPIIELIKQLGDYTSAEVTAAVVSGMSTVFVETDADESDGAGGPVIGERPSGEGLAQDEVKLGNGAIVSLAPGEKASFVNPTRPNDKFDPFVLALLRQIGVALELPLEVLIKHFTASYSASKAAIEMAAQFFRRRRSWLARRLCQVVYCWIIEEAVAIGRLSAPGFFEDPLVAQAYCGARWIGPPKMSLNPLQEAEADALDISLGTKTREQVCTERTGGEWEKKHRQSVKEHNAIVADGLDPTPVGPEKKYLPPDEEEAQQQHDDEQGGGYASRRGPRR